MTKGFSLLEMLIVVAIVGTLLAISFVAIMRFRAIAEINDVQQLVVQEINRARSDVFRLGIDYTVSWTADKLIIEGKEKREVDLSSSDNVKIGSGNDSVRYNAPYATISVSYKTIKLEAQKGINRRTAEVLIYGVTGKVFTH